MTGPTAVAFGKDDAVAPAKILSQFAKENEALKIKGGVVEGRVVGFDEIKALADLPSREGLLSMLLSVLQAPVRNFALAVKAVADKKEAEAESHRYITHNSRPIGTRQNFNPDGGLIHVKEQILGSH